MSQTAIPLQFEQYMQNQISIGNVPDMNEMIFAYLPNLDLGLPIDRDQGLPDVATWVHQQDVDQVGKIGDNALAYSVVILGTVPAFTFNAIYLRDKNVPNSCGMIVFKADETKEDGMASSKSLLQAYTGAAQIAGITVDAGTWQIDYQARLLGIEEDQRLACLDTYGHSAFIDGFEVSQEADSDKYKITSGLVYIGGLRTLLKNEVIQTIVTKPTSIYLDVVRTGTALSKWENQLTVVISETELTDHVDGSGQQHYVAKVAVINADGSVSDARLLGGNQLFERVDNAATDAEIDAQSTAPKHVKLSQLWRAISNKITLGFSMSLGEIGYIAFPSFLGGLILQWGRAVTLEGGFVVVDYPISFPNKSLEVLTSLLIVFIPSLFIVGNDSGSNSQTTLFAQSTSGNGISGVTLKWFSIGH